ncbi:MAG: ADP-ribosylglycohydrolase family protein, partial [Mailhella sp.]|nr:ADP-ribosylglycohydrolase family protein [Mailhella sp.]
ESVSFEDAVRNAISLGGDSDTIGAMAGSMAEAFFGIPQELREKALSYLDGELVEVVTEFEASYSSAVHE